MPDRAHTVTIETYSPVLHEQLRVLATPIGRADGKWVVVSGASLAAVDDAVDRVEFGLALGVALIKLIASIRALRCRDPDRAGLTRNPTE